MSTALHLVGGCLFACIGIISVFMALKALTAREFLPFQKAAAGKAWDEIGGGAQAVMTSLLRLSGLGFLVVGVQLGVAAAGILYRDLVVTVASAVLSLGFCAGLCLVNLRLHRQTGAKTPWRGSLYATIAVAIALVLSIIR